MASGRRLSRRQFIARAASAAFAAPLVAHSSAFGANDTITMGCIGMGGRGRTDMRSFMGFREVRVLAVCDVIEGHRRRSPGAERELLRQHLDAVHYPIQTI